MGGGGPFRALRELYFRSPISVWRLGRDAGLEIAVPLTDAWPGSAELGRSIVDGTVVTGGATIAETGSVWRKIPDDRLAMEALHGFVWLRHLREHGGEAARITARDMVGGWLDTHDGWHPLVWRPDILGERISAWLGMHDFFCGSADDTFRGRVLASIARQAGHVARDLDATPDGVRRLRAIKGLVAASVALGADDDRLRLSERTLLQELSRQVNSDGGHVSRSPAVQTEALMALIDIRNGFRARGWPVPDLLDDAIDRMTAMLRLWRHGDGRLALFNQTTEGAPALLESVIAQSESRRKAALEAPDTGFQRLTAGRTCVIVDTGMPSGLENHAHASPLAFEFSAGKQRLVVNCGTSLGDARWRGPLRASAAHSMLIIDDHNAAEVSTDGRVGGRPASVVARRGAEAGAILLEAEHDGYGPTHGLTHHRRLFLSAAGDDLRGEDRLVYSGDPGELPVEVVIRFHLHPRVSASVIQSGASALLRPPSGGGWRMRTDHGLSLNESVYFGAETRQRSEQIVIARSLDGIRESGEIAIRWALRREDGRAS